MTGNSTQTILDVARQHLLTARLLGVDFVPLRDVERGGNDGSVSMIAISVRADGDRSPAAAEDHHRPTEAPDTSWRSRALEELRQRHDASCPHCTGATFHSRTVFGEGDPCATLMFIGEAPGEEEDRTGRPFVGRAGQKLDEIIRAMGLGRQQVYIANVLKSRPPANRTPLQLEVDACAPFLAEQIRIIQPRVIVALGGPAAKWLLQSETGITRLRGQWGEYRDGELLIPIMPTFHPAYILRNYTVDTRQKVWSDMKAVLAKLDESPIAVH